MRRIRQKALKAELTQHLGRVPKKSVIRAARRALLRGSPPSVHARQGHGTPLNRRGSAKTNRLVSEQGQVARRIQLMDRNDKERERWLALRKDLRQRQFERIRAKQVRAKKD